MRVFFVPAAKSAAKRLQVDSKCTCMYRLVWVRQRNKPAQCNKSSTEQLHKTKPASTQQYKQFNTATGKNNFTNKTSNNQAKQNKTKLNNSNKQQAQNNCAKQNLTTATSNKHRTTSPSKTSNNQANEAAHRHEKESAKAASNYYRSQSNT